MSLRFLQLSSFCILLGVSNLDGATTTLHSQVYQEGLWPSDRSATGPFRQYADLFTLAQESSVTQVTFWGVYDGDVSGGLPVDTFSLEFYDPIGASIPAAPNVTIALNEVTRTAFDGGAGTGVYQYTATISPQILAAGQHGFSIYNDLTGVSPVWNIGESQDLSGTSFFRQESTDPWSIGGGEHALILEGEVVPEPSAGLLVIGSLMMGLFRRRRASRFHITNRP